MNEQIPCGEVIIFEAIPNENYVFTHWVGFDNTVISEDNPYEVTIKDHLLLIAVFQQHMNLSELDIFDISIVPNPVDNDFTIIFDNLVNQFVTIELIDITGVKLVSIFDGFLSAGQKTFVVSESLLSGTYYVRFGLNERQFLRKIIKR